MLKTLEIPLRSYNNVFALEIKLLHGIIGYFV